MKKLIQHLISFLVDPKIPLPALLSLLLLVSSTIQSEAQYFRVFNIDAKNFPVVTANFLLSDSSGNQISSIDKKSVKIEENGKSGELLSIHPPQKTSPQPLSIVLSFDVSHSMNQKRLHIAKEAGKEFVKMLPLEQSECAITSFDNLNYLNQDFSYSETKLTEAIDSLDAAGGTNYNSGFSMPYAGALNIASDGEYKKIVIFLTDGLGEGDKANIIKKANKNDITVYPVTIEMEMPVILKEIAEQTGGKSYEKVNSAEKAKQIYREILYTSQSTSFGTIKWRSNAGCSKKVSASFSINQHQIREEYTLNAARIHRLVATPKYLSFTPDKDSLKTVELAAKNGNFIIEEFEFNKESSFFLPEQNLPENLNKGEKHSINIGFDKEAISAGFTRLSIKNNKCPATGIYLKAKGASPGSSLLKLTEPNGGEIFTAGTDTTISWEGVTANDTVSLAFSDDDGNTWSAVSKTDGLKTSWKVPPQPGTKNRIRVSPNEKNREKIHLSFLYSPGGRNYKAHRAHFIKKDKFFLTINDNHSLSLWEGNSGEHIKTFSAHNKWIYDISDNTENDLIVTASDDGSAKIFNISTGEEKNIFRKNTWGINKSLFSEDGKKVITAGDDGTIRVWNIKEKQIDYSFRAHAGWIMDIALSPDGKQLASIGDDQRIKIWDMKTYSRVMSILAHRSWVHDVEYSPDGEKLITAGKDSTVRIWNANNGNLIQTIDDFNGEVFTVSFSPEGKFFATTSKDRTLRIYSTKSGELAEYKKLAQGNRFLNAFFDHSGNRIISADKEKNIKVWGIETKSPFKEDMSDKPFSIISPLPAISDIKFHPQQTGKVIDTIIESYFKNNELHPVYVKDVSISGRNKDAFQLISPAGDFTISPNEAVPVEMQFAPEKRGDYQAQISVSSDTKSIEKEIKGTAIEPGYRILTHQHDFGQVEINEKSETTLPLIENTGDYQLKIKNLKLSGSGKNQFTIEEIIPENQIEPGEKGKIKIGFKPSQGGKSNSKIQFNVSDYEEQEIVNLFGEGDAPRKVRIMGKILRSKDSSAIAANVDCYDMQSNHRMDSVQSKTNFSFNLKRGRKYRLTARKEDYIPSGIHIDLQKHPGAHSLKRNIYLSEVRIGAKARLNNIFFEHDKSKLTEGSKGELNQVYSFLKKYQSLKIELAGHTDSTGSKQYNKKLSLARAKSVKQFLVEKGIKQERIRVAGYGENRPVATNSTKKGREQNRRVEFEIIEKD